MAYKKLELLTEGQEGYGVIVEWNTRRGCSGEISMGIQDEKVVKEILKEMDEKGAASKRPNSILMNCILQKCDTENRNGRFYPRYLLEREDKAYQKYIQEGNAGGEANHPDCYHPNTELLTEKGWKYFSDITDNEIVFTLNPETNKIELHKINFKVDQNYKGLMYNFKGLNLDLSVTPNHRFLLEDRHGKRFFKTAEEIEVSYSNKWKILKTGEWNGEDSEIFIIPGLKENEFTNNSKKYFIEKFSHDIKIDSKIWFSFLGLYLAEGSAMGSKSKKYGHGYVSKITQKKPENILKIRELLNKLPFNIREKKYKDGKIDFFITDIRLHKYLLKLGDSYNKYIPDEIKKYSSRLLSLLFDWFKLGDGRTVGKNDQSCVFSTSEKLINDLHEILIKIGGSGSIRKEARDNDKYITDTICEDVENEFGELELIETKVKRLIKGINCHSMYFLNISKTKNIYLDKRFIKIEKINYEGSIHCVNVQNNNIYVRRNGQALWCGNTSNIDILNISHRVVKSWWEGNTLLGVLEIMTSEAFHQTGAEYNSGDKIAGLLKRGYKLGISSRGVGSLKNIGGKNTVQDDFELICYDLVASPSTPGAYLYPDTEVKLNESIVAEKVENFSSSLITKIDEFLNK